MDQLHLITVREAAETQLPATGAQLAVRIAGQSLVTGGEAFKKAAEVANLLADLKACGLSDEYVKLLSVSVEVEHGLLVKSSSAAYLLSIECPAIESLGKVLSAVSGQKNAQIVSLAWKYHDLAKAKQGVIQSAVKAANESAMGIAQALSAQLTGVHKLSYDISGLDNELHFPAAGLKQYRGIERRKAIIAPLENLGLSHVCNLKVTVNAEFTVAPFAAEAG